MRSCAYEKYGQIDGHGEAYVPPKTFVCCGF